MSTSAQTVRRRGRPSKHGMERGEARERLLHAGLEVLTEKSFSATGIDEILRRVGIPKGSFYYYFESKEAFGAELISRYGAYFAAKLARHLENPSRPPLARIRDFVADARAGMAHHHYQRGCLIGNLGQEMGSLPESYRQQLGGVFEDWQRRLADCLEAAREAGEIAPEADCHRLAAFFWIGWEGAVLRAKLDRDPEALEIFADGFFAALASA